MTGNILSYYEAVEPLLPSEIVPAETKGKITRLARLFRDFAASEYIMETCLHADDGEADFSFRVLSEEKAALIESLRKSEFSDPAWAQTWGRIIDFAGFWPADLDDIWLEMDYNQYDAPMPQPCFFFNAAKIKTNAVIFEEQLLWDALHNLIDERQLSSLWPHIKKAVNYLPAEAGLFQVGVMLARHADRVRIFTAELTREQTLSYLACLGWPGSTHQLEKVFDLIHASSDGQYIVDFDVTQEGISSKIGINFGLAGSSQLPAFLDNLVQHRMCTANQKAGVMAWSGSTACFLGSDYGMTAIIKDVSHYKISCTPGEALKIKSYLRFAGVYLKQVLAGSFFDPANVKEEHNPQEPFKEMQNLYKQTCQMAMLDKDFRQLCLQDSLAALQLAASKTRSSLPISFVEEEPTVTTDHFVCVLPQFLKPSWLLSK